MSATDSSPWTHLFALQTFTEVSRIITSSKNADETLTRTAGMIAERMQVDACSIYIFDSSQNLLILKATHGLNPLTVEEVRMPPKEVLVCLVLENREPFQDASMQEHPRFKPFPKTNEANFSTFLGVPLVENRKSFGVLVVHTVESREFRTHEVELLTAIGSQISSLVSKALLLKQLDHAAKRHPAQSPNTTPSSFTLSGNAVAPGIALGKAVRMHPTTPEEPPRESTQTPEEELRDFHTALEHTINDTMELVEKITGDVGPDEASIFHVHLMFLEDHTFQEKIEHYIHQGNSVSWSIYQTIEEYLQAFDEIQDPYLREKGADLKDVGYRLLHYLGHELLSETEKEGILVIAQLLPGDMARLDTTRIKGIVTASGGVVSHAAILARSLMVPAICVDETLMVKIHEGDMIALDGKSGNAVIHPGDEMMDTFKRRVLLEQQHQEHLDQLREIPCQTQDKVRVKMLANVALENDLHQLIRHGAEGIGLYRTEIYFLSLDRFPEVEEQVEVYHKVIHHVPRDQPVMIRTLDLGADKAANYMGYQYEDNPFLGCRALRRQLKKPLVLKNQIKAILLASKGRNDVHLIFPMVTEVREIQQAKSIMRECRDELKIAGHSVSNLRVGMMFEVPAAYLICGRFMPEIDFCAIGSNDLTQYVLAVDRTNTQISHLYDPLHPAVLQLIARLIETANKHQKPIELCGEMASDPDGCLILLGLGLRTFSMNVSLIPVVKERISTISLIDAEKLAAEALNASSALDVRNLIRAHFGEPIMNRPFSQTAVTA